MVTKERLCSPIPTTSSSLPHTHAATGNKTVTYDFAPIISQEGCLYFTLEQRKEAKTINLSCAELNVGSAPTQLCVPLMSAEHGLPAKLLSPKCDCALEAYFGPSQRQEGNGRNVNHPKASPELPSAAVTRSCARSWSIFFHPSAARSKRFEDVYQFCWLLSKIIAIAHFSEPEHLAFSLPAFTAQLTHLRRKNQVRFYLGEFPREWKLHILANAAQNWRNPWLGRKVPWDTTTWSSSFTSPSTIDM